MDLFTEFFRAVDALSGPPRQAERRRASGDRETHDEMVKRLCDEVNQGVQRHFNDLLQQVMLSHGPTVYQAVVARLVQLQQEQFQDRYRDHPGASDSCYSTLGVTRDAPDAVVKAAYHALALQHHPDRNDNSHAMASINVAYQQVAALRGWTRPQLPVGSANGRGG